MNNEIELEEIEFNCVKSAHLKGREMLSVQGVDGTFNYDQYNHGMYNGMEYMLALFEDRIPVFRDAPDKWLHEKSNL